MAHQTPYLQRRGDTFAFRIAVPKDLQPVIRYREVSKCLHTGDKRIALPRALALAAKTKLLFHELRMRMETGNKDGLLELVRQAKHKLELDALREQHEEEMIEERRWHLREQKRSAVQIVDVVTQLIASGLLARGGAMDRESSASVAQKNGPTCVPETPTLSAVVQHFLDNYRAAKKGEMYKKHSAVLPMFRDLVGARKPVSAIKQVNINEFFDIVNKLPPRWKDEIRRRKLTIRELAALPHPVSMSPKTFEDTYKACIRAFLTAAKRDWQDQGFPTTLTTDGIEYDGDREEGESKQRALKLEELKRLFQGPEMRAFANDSSLAHCFWLPTIGLLTGARVNEICQLNPRDDILEENGMWFFWITEETEGDERIKKRTKNKISRRKVPFHPILLQLDLPSYVKRVREQGAKLLFPQWKPSRGKASSEAEKWFRDLLRDIGLRDETPGACVLGMHVFRHTFITRARDLGLNVQAITGHAKDQNGVDHKSEVVRGYEGELPLEIKKRTLDAITFDIQFVKPAH